MVTLGLFQTEFLQVLLLDCDCDYSPLCPQSSPNCGHDDKELKTYTDQQTEKLTARVADGFEEVKELLDVRERVKHLEAEYAEDQRGTTYQLSEWKLMINPELEGRDSTPYAKST